MSSVSALMGLYAQTSIHAGTGQGTGVIDLPIQREGHTGWPCVFGSAVKGALRARAESGALDEQQIYAVFGPDTNNASEHAGALAVGDARILLLPVRSLTTHFKWVTCPAVLQRFKADNRRLSLPEGDWTVPKIGKEEEAVATQAGDLFLEEYRFTTKAEDLKGLIAHICTVTGETEGSVSEMLAAQLVIVHDSVFRHLCEQATPVNAHVAIDSKTKTVEPGALWYEETLPPETVLYVPLSAVSARRKESGMDAAQVLQTFWSIFASHDFLQLGGNETVGMGWCRANLVEAG